MEVSLKNSIQSLFLPLGFLLMQLPLIFRSQSVVNKKQMILSPLLKRCCELFGVWKLEGYSSTSTTEKSETKWKSPHLWKSIQAHIKEEWESYFRRYLVNEHQVSCMLHEKGRLWEKWPKNLWKGIKLRLQLSMNPSISLFLGTWLRIFSGSFLKSCHAI